MKSIIKPFSERMKTIMIQIQMECNFDSVSVAILLGDKKKLLNFIRGLEICETRNEIAFWAYLLGTSWNQMIRWQRNEKDG